MNKKLITLAISTLFAGTLAAQDSNTPNPDGNSDPYGRDTRGQTNRSFRNATGTNSRPGYGRDTRGRRGNRHFTGKHDYRTPGDKGNYRSGDRRGQRRDWNRNDGSGRRNQYGRDTRGLRDNRNFQGRRDGQRFQGRRSGQGWNRNGRHANLTPQQRQEVRRIRMQARNGQISRQEAGRRIRMITGRDGFRGRRNNRTQDGRGFQGRRNGQDGRRMHGRRSWNRDDQGRDSRPPQGGHDDRNNGQDD